MIGKQKAAGAGAKLAMGGILVSAALAGTAGAASAAPVHTLPATLSASGAGAHASWNGNDSVKLTVGTPTTSTFAQVALAHPPSQAPATAPTFRATATPPRLATVSRPRRPGPAATATW